ncbi:polyketide cyclase [Nocardioides bruguierae]|uniref:Polyketide cyclase n=1 Tax=Nocardioides bruguierae TaxID=2945102 RepID=A0A9X2IDS9_9ACTN|nr:polyketide cyclase [Nocardioides bruguierae]MCM0620076.1 polyketide cyclase [Nocardioides bruguierae]
MSASTEQDPAERIEVSRMLASPASAVFSLLRDPQGHVDMDASGMLMDATGGVVSAVGDRFTVHMDREALGDLPMGEYDVEVVIEVYEPDREIAWSIIGTVKPSIGRRYGYRLDPATANEDGSPRTLVTSYYDWSTARPEWKAIFPVVPEQSLKASLGVLARTVRRRQG